MREHSVEIAVSRPEEGSRSHHADAHDIIGQRDHPEPPMLEEVHGNHSLDITTAPPHVAEVAEYRGRVVALVDPRPPETAGDQRIAPRSIDEKARDKERPAPTCVARPDRYASLVTELDLGHAHFLDHARTQTSTVVEQQLVEIRTPDVIAMLDLQVRIIGEEECRHPFVGVGNDLG